MAHNGSGEASYWVNPTPNGTLLVSPPATGTFVTTNTARNVLYNPGFNNWNLGLFKKFAINERTGFQFRAEAYDVFNHPNWSGVGTDPTNLGTFLKVTNKSGDARNLQLSLRFYF